MSSRIPIRHIGSVIYFTFDAPKIMVSSPSRLWEAAMYGALLTAIVTGISANFELPPDYNHPSIKLGPAVQINIPRAASHRSG